MSIWWKMLLACMAGGALALAAHWHKQAQLEHARGAACVAAGGVYMQATVRQPGACVPKGGVGA